MPFSLTHSAYFHFLLIHFIYIQNYPFLFFQFFYFKIQVPSYDRRRLSLRHESLRRGSIVAPISKEVPWDIFDRLFLPLLYCHAIAIIFSAILSFFEIQFAFSTFGVFILLSIATVSLTLFYHNLKVSLLIFILFMLLSNHLS